MKLPLLLVAYQCRFARDEQAMARHLIDDVPVGWEELGTDLLDGAPPELVTALTGGQEWPSSTLDNLVTPDGSPPARMTVTHEDAAEQDFQWGYVLRPDGIEVISPAQDATGPLVDWNTDPRTIHTNHPDHWTLRATGPVGTPVHTPLPRTGAAPSARRR
ncbi:hypothetical protein PUR57_01605 [Streptomyces sp. JV176]|uniref:hypothetical protein n=1 Tax=Streptomyces sp. JV176 TaxID=858630 RepID=UPI002E75B234|nr:hypothetical protein [Streptomyces sp. JV176]MEE1797396.1 hypothetical protein [Streptomyces sp. JV176]